MYLKEGEERKGVDLHLVPGTMIRGTVRQSDGTLDSRQSVTIRQLGAKLPKVGTPPFYTQEELQRWLTTDDRGQYAFHVGPGTYELRAAGIDAREKLTVANETEIVRDFQLEKAGSRRPLTGRVLGAEGKPVAGARVRSAPLKDGMPVHSGFIARTDAQGRFAAECATEPLIVCASDPSGDSAACFLLEEDKKEFTLRLEPAGRLVGHIVDPQGQPLVNQEVNYQFAAHVGGESAEFTFHNDYAISDAKGDYVIAGLPVGSDGHILLLNSGRSSYESVSQFEIKQAGVSKLPDLTRANRAAAGGKNQRGGAATRPAAGAGHQMVTGVVIDEESGKPLAGALVRIAVPARDMREVRSPGAGVYEGRTDAQGQFEIGFPVKGESTFSLDAFAAGYESAAGTLMGGSFRYENLSIRRGQPMEFTIGLKKGMYVAGTVSDEDGKPLKGVQVEATEREEKGYAYVRVTATDERGRFEVFDFMSPADLKKRPGVRGQLAFENSGKVRQVVEDVFKLNEDERKSLKIIMRRGRTVSGRLLDAQGHPAAKILVSAIPIDKLARKENTTDAEGRFAIHGLPDGTLTIRAHAMGLKQKVQTTLPAADKDADITLRLEPVVLEHPPEPVELLGMKVANMTPELQKLYDQYDAKGVIILDPGPNSQHLGIGALVEGNRFWMIGNKKIKDLREMVAELLRISDIPPPTRGGMIDKGYRGNIRVVYEYGDGKGTSTQYMKLTDKDVAELKKMATTLGNEPAATAPANQTSTKPAGSK